VKGKIISLAIVLVIVVVIIAFVLSKYVMKPSSTTPSNYPTPASTLSALLSNSQASYNTAGKFGLTYKLYFVNTSSGENYTGNYSFFNNGNSFNISLYSLQQLLPNVVKVEHVYSTFNSTKISQCSKTYFANTSVVNSTLIAAINKANANSTEKCSLPLSIPSNISAFDAAYSINTLPVVLFTPIAGYTIYYFDPNIIFANSTITSLGQRSYLRQGCNLYNITIKSYPENVTLIECISDKFGLPLSSVEESSNQVLMSTNISSFGS
jgi:hypothetical protein